MKTSVRSSINLEDAVWQEEKLQQIIDNLKL